MFSPSPDANPIPSATRAKKNRATRIEGIDNYYFGVLVIGMGVKMHCRVSGPPRNCPATVAQGSARKPGKGQENTS